METILDEVSFDADEREGEMVVIDEALIEQKLEKIVESEDATRYIL